ncbi:cytochrome P450 55A1 [Colletotrichum tabaci]|uniref:Cytochrome P450 55A1 n=1 Tax=Colletotrichum tabaci TaxID=1209068 RepID=A0AAV9T3Q4_9PEZI
MAEIHKSIYTILGVPFEDLEYLTQQNAIRTNSSGPALQAQSAKQALLSSLVNLVNQRSIEPKYDLIALFLLVSRNATMVNMFTLVSWRNQALARPISAGGTRIRLSPYPAFFEELCRYHAASAMTMKHVAKEDVVHAGKRR